MREKGGRDGEVRPQTRVLFVLFLVRVCERTRAQTLPADTRPLVVGPHTPMAQRADPCARACARTGAAAAARIRAAAADVRTGACVCGRTHPRHPFALTHCALVRARGQPRIQSQGGDGGEAAKTENELLRVGRANDPVTHSRG